MMKRLSDHKVKQGIGLAAAACVLAATAHATLILDLTTDTFGGETSFTLVSVPGNVAQPFDSASPAIGGGDNFADTGELISNTVYQFTWDNLGNGDYSFTMLDSFGDGLGLGSYALSLDGTQIGSGGGNFGTADTPINFTVSAESSTFALAALGLVGLAIARRRRRDLARAVGTH